MATLYHAMPPEHVFPKMMRIEYLLWVISSTSMVFGVVLSIFHSFTKTVGRLSYIWNAAENATEYVQLTFGVFFSELAQNFRAFLSGKEPYKLRFYVGHDGTMIRLAAGLGLGKYATLRWPGLGSEIVMEVSGRTEGDELYVSLAKPAIYTGLANKTRQQRICACNASGITCRSSPVGTAGGLHRAIGCGGPK
jgi:hypothetical protein